MEGYVKVESLGGFRGLLDVYRNNKKVITVLPGGLSVCQRKKPSDEPASRWEGLERFPCVWVVAE